MVGYYGNVPVQADYDFVVHVTRFCRTLRGRGFLVGPRETADAIRGTGLMDVLDRGQVYWTLRAVLPSRQDEIGVFDELFETFWNFDTLPGTTGLERGESDSGAAPDVSPNPPREGVWLAS